MTIRVYKDHIEKASELLVVARAYESVSLGYLYEAVVAITQAINELESVRDEK